MRQQYSWVQERKLDLLSAVSVCVCSSKEEEREEGGRRAKNKERERDKRKEHKKKKQQPKRKTKDKTWQMDKDFSIEIPKSIQGRYHRILKHAFEFIYEKRMTQELQVFIDGHEHQIFISAINFPGILHSLARNLGNIFIFRWIFRIK